MHQAVRIIVGEGDRELFSCLGLNFLLVKFHAPQNTDFNPTSIVIALRHQSCRGFAEGVHLGFHLGVADLRKGLIAEVIDKASKAGPTLEVPGLGKPGEVLLAQFRRPSFGDILECEDIVDLLPLRVVGLLIQKAISILPGTLEKFIVKFDLLKADGFLTQERHSFSDHGGITEVDKHIHQLSIKCISFSGVKRADRLDDRLGSGDVWFPHPDKAEGENAEGLQLLRFVHGGWRQLAQCVKQRPLMACVTLSGQGEKRGQRGLKVIFIKGFGCPVAHRLMFEGNPCGVADEAILMPEGAPDLFNGTSNCFTVVLLEITPRLPECLSGLCVREAPVL